MKNEYQQFKNFVSYSEDKFSKKLSKSDFPFRITLKIDWNGSQGAKVEKNKAEYAPPQKSVLKATYVLQRHKH